MNKNDEAFINVMDGNELENHNHSDFNRYSAPTQSFLQKWIREKYKIHIEIHYWNVYYTVFVDKYGDCDGEYNSYEEALEVGLQEALKLI